VYVSAITHTAETVSQLVAKLSKGVTAMENLYNRPAPDCGRILELMESTEDIACAWSEEEVKALYHDYRHKRFNAHNISDHEETWEKSNTKMDRVSHVTPIRGKASFWYLMKSQDRRQYWIGRALMVDHQEYDGDQWRGVRIQYWEAKNPRNKLKSKHYARDAPRCKHHAR
jgi:hypothetical protein